MLNLDNIEEVKKIDKVNVAGSITELSLQFNQAWEEAGKINFPKNYFGAENIVFSGMGGSALGAYVAKTLFLDELSLPFEIVNDYHLPEFVNSKSLVILSSYSGTTEETLSCASDALARKANISGLTTGGKLAEFFKASNIPSYVFNPKHNPSNQPRMGIGYSIAGLLSLLRKLNLITLDSSILKQTIAVLEKGTKLFGLESKTENNPAKQVATQLVGKIPVIVAAEFMTNIGRVIRNQFNENAKSFAAFHDLPELNHHLMEGLMYPKSNRENLYFMFFRSNNYSSRILKRFQVTKDVVEKNGLKHFEFIPRSESRFSQVAESIQFGSYVTYYLALLYQIDPSKIPWVDYFKAQLAS